jgi:hypothetical protein
MAAVGNSPISGDSKQTTAALQLSSRLKNCWKTDFDWTLVPTTVKEVDVIISVVSCPAVPTQNGAGHETSNVIPLNYVVYPIALYQAGYLAEM